MNPSGIPSAQLPVSAQAPGKCILFGEHAVVFGKPELILAIDLTTQVGLTRGTTGNHRLNSDDAATSRNSYFRIALESFPPPSPLEVRVVSRIPRAAGLGSSAAFVAALTATLASLHGGIDRPTLADASFQVERTAQGVGSPGDTTAVVAGGYVSINGGTGGPLWRISDGELQWEVRSVADPGWSWLVAYSGIPRQTADAVRAVGRRVGEADGPVLLERFESVALAGIDAVHGEDRDAVGRLLSQNQELLREVGVSHPRLEALLASLDGCVVGAKLTGAGAGGSIVALPQPGKETEALRRIARAGGVPYIVRASPKGASLVEPPPGVAAVP